MPRFRTPFRGGPHTWRRQPARTRAAVTFLAQEKCPLGGALLPRPLLKRGGPDTRPVLPAPPPRAGEGGAAFAPGVHPVAVLVPVCPLAVVAVVRRCKD
eukprot:CAMPEP_0181356754 /NCGR_PEP_ID=MMETSP1106-20121128/4592_1 /TAXON_ID=81844 /ORGANISM="Mantoniella antarctica, Strain SL-175" /LENGTH=98 /DNA_ID=CAMNT_0023469563 /DNA_START=524 /DNA_END=820 /DNA_ORIENTATION=+